MRVIGTAGHVDHGKSTLVLALTGIDPDRLKEEKARGMTIDLGFAWFDLAMLPHGDSGKPRDDDAVESIGVVDVPGHIDFIKNMLAGVGGIDAAMLVIAADEGVMPQTREHLAILDLLAAPALLVALTKVDLVDDEEWLDLVELDVVDLLRGTQFADAPVVRVSALTGAGLPELRTQLAKQLQRLPPRRNRAAPRLPVDRVFSLSGFGTIVTGTLSDGVFGVGDAVEVLPSGQAARIRGVQTHKQQVPQAEPGSRVALNLTGVGTDAIARGHVVVRPRSYRTTMLVDVAFRLLADAPKPLAHNQQVDFYCGATEVSARARVLGADEIRPGQEGWLQLRLSAPVVVTAGDHYILRQPSPSLTLGGGRILAPHPRRRWRRFDPALLARLETLAQGAPDAVLLETLARRPFLSADELIATTGLDIDLARETLGELRRQGALVELGSGEPMLLTQEGWNSALAQLRTVLQTYHTQFPLRRGMPREEVRSRLQPHSGSASVGLRLFNGWIEGARAAGLVEGDESLLWLSNFAVVLSAEQQALVDRLLAQFAELGYTPPSATDALRIVGDERLLDLLLEQGRLVRLPGGVLFRREEFERMRDAIQGFLAERATITLAETRDLFDTSRKYAQAVLEEMDARRITRRDGDVRVLRRALNAESGQ
jgi:selenocysteine-specific elongation factor